MNYVGPFLSKVRNDGWDGSGVTCSPNNVKIARSHESQKIDTAPSFCYEGNGFAYYKHNCKTYIKEDYDRINLLIFLKKILFAICHKFTKL